MQVDVDLVLSVGDEVHLAFDKGPRMVQLHVYYLQLYVYYLVAAHMLLPHPPFLQVDVDLVSGVGDEVYLTHWHRAYHTTVVFFSLTELLTCCCPLHAG
jgi:hypothetical protein